MSADSSTHRYDVVTDDAAGGRTARPSPANLAARAPGTVPSSTGHNGSAADQKAADEQPRPRRNRRGGRRRRARRNPDHTPDSPQRAGLTDTTAATGPAKRDRSGPSPASMPTRKGDPVVADDAAAAQQATQQPAQQPARKPKPAPKKAPTGSHTPPKPGPRPQMGPEPSAGADGEPARTRVSGPKPSDLVSVTATITKTGLSHGGTTGKTTGPRNDGCGDSKSRRRRGAANQRIAEKDAEKLRTVRETSAGGLVISDLDLPVEQLSAALIGRVDRRGRMMWSLPKGHIETGETAEQTAIREVAEETGIEGTVVAPLGKIDYWFVSEGRRIHKTVHHYLLRSTGGELSDADYEVSEVAWVPLQELPRRLTYSDERRLARMARGVIADLAADPHRLAQSEAQSIRTEPNAYERAAAARNQRRNDPPPPARSRRRRRRARRPASGDA